MELVSLHPFDPIIAERYVAALRGEAMPDPAWSSWWDPALVDAVEQSRASREEDANRLSLGLAWALSGEHPAFVQEGFGLTVWEARVDRGVGMLMRPPSRLFIDAGLDRAAVRNMPIRIDLHAGMMGGAYIPFRLMGDLSQLLETRLERMARRLNEAEYDAFSMLGLLHEAVGYAQERQLGLYEAMDAVGPLIPGMQLIEADKKRLDPELRRRIQAAITPEKKPGIFGRLFRRKKSDEQ